MSNSQRACAFLPAADLVQARHPYDSEGDLLAVTKPTDERLPSLSSSRRDA